MSYEVSYFAKCLLEDIFAFRISDVIHILLKFELKHIQDWS